MNKILVLAIACLLFTLFCSAQSVAINTDASIPNRNAILDVKSGNKGILIPRMTTEARNRIPNTQGLLVYDVSTDNFWFNTGRGWQCIPRDDDRHGWDGDAWLIKGNSNTKDRVNFLGTTNNVPLNVRVNNRPSGRIDSAHGVTFWGYKAGFSDNPLDSPTRNTGIGAYALMSNTSGSWNTAVGNSALVANTTGYGNSAVGFQALNANTMGAGNTATGYYALKANTTAVGNTANGYGSLQSNATGYNNTAVGFASMYLCATGYNNSGYGAFSLYSTTTGFYNSGYGAFSLFTNTTGTENTALGSYSMEANYNGSRNTAVGAGAFSFNFSGSENVATGYRSLSRNNSGVSNVAVGFQAVYNNESGNSNVGLGAIALNGNLSGNNNTAVGAGADVSAGNLTNATALGSGAVVNASNKVRIGNAAVTVIEGQVPFTTPSDGRFKYNVREDVKGLDFILQLRPVTYQFDVRRFDAAMDVVNVAYRGYDEASRIRRTGFIAQEVEKAAQETGYDFSGIIRPKTDKDHYSLSYDAFVVPLVKAVQQQQEIIDGQTKRLADQEKRIALLEQSLEELKKHLSK